MELMLMGLGCCSAYDVVHILNKGRQAITDCQADLTAERSSEVPAVFTRIHLHFTITGRDLNPSRVERAVRLSVEKYCSASRMLETGGVAVTHDYEVVSKG